MVDVDTFLTTLYVMVDDFCTTSLPPEPHPGPQAALSRSEVVTLALFGQWQRFGSERGFYRYAQRHLRPAFPQLPTQECICACRRERSPALSSCPSGGSRRDTSARSWRYRDCPETSPALWPPVGRAKKPFVLLIRPRQGLTYTHGANAA